MQIRELPTNNRRHARRQFFQEADAIEGFSWFDRLHGYVYITFPYLYIAVGTANHWLAKAVIPLLKAWGKLHPKKQDTRRHSLTEKSGTIADTYHGKALPLESAKTLVQVKEDIRIEDLEQVIPYVDARALIMHHPDHIVVLDCPCREAQENPCLPLDVCLIVGEPFASYVLAHHPEKSRQINAAEAEKILEEEDQRGHVHHAFFKDAMLGRFYAICNCCSCCCGAMRAHRNAVPMLASSGYLVAVDLQQCQACGTCATYCQFGALALIDGVLQVNEAECMGCGVCVSKCEQGALSLQLAPEKGAPFELSQLMEKAVAKAFSLQ